MPCKIEYLTFSLLLALSACSGGGDSLLPGILDADSNVDSQEALILNEENYTELSSLASELVNSQILYAQEIGKLLSLVDTSSSQLLTPQCTTSGSLDTDVIDNDQNQRLSAGDQVSFQFRSCTDDSGRQLDGRVSLSLSMVDDLEPGSIHTRFNAELNDFLSNQRIDDNSTVTINRNGRLTADILYSPERVSISVINPESGVIHDVTANEERQTLTNSGSVTSDIASRSSVRLQLRAAQREYDYSNYTYSLSFDAVIQQSNWANPLELETTNPFSGVINSFPIEGGVQLSAGQNSRLRINPEAPGSTLTVPQLDTGDGIFNQVSRTPWGLLANLNLWTDPRIKNEVRIRTYIPDDRDMEFLYQSSVEEGKNVLLNQRFLLQFSDVIDTEAIEQSSLSVYFQSLSTTLAPSVNGVAEISGAQLVAYPEQPLMPGENYRLYINSVYNSQGDSDDTS